MEDSWLKLIYPLGTLANNPGSKSRKMLPSQSFAKSHTNFSYGTN